LTFCERINFPLEPLADERFNLLEQKINHLQNRHKINKQNLKEELKEVVSEFRFGETESRGLFDSFKSLLQERRRLKPVKSIKRTVQLKRQRQIRFLVSLLKASEVGFDANPNEIVTDTFTKKVVKWSIVINSLIYLIIKCTIPPKTILIICCK
jgi:predicted RNA-binding protein